MGRGRRPRDRIEAIGPRGTILIDPEADHHLFVGDDSAIPATFAMLEALQATDTATILLEIETPSSERPVPASAASTAAHCVGLGAIPGAIAHLAVPGGRCHAYVNGEASMVRAARQALTDAGLSADAISTKAYWRQDQPNADHGEPSK